MRRHRGATLLALLLVATTGGGTALVIAQEGASAPAAAAPAPAAADGFSTEQLEQLVAPIALHPDSLLTQILMAATYPLEVVEADRWLQGAGKGLSGSALEAALKDQEWDPSVKALCTLPDVLKMMSENLDWTQDLGDAFLGQKAELLDTVQKMRGKAHESGNLKSSEQQVVTVEKDNIIVIESSSPEVVYVPTYSPTVVYGGWSYPSYYYPPMYPYYPPGAGLVTFGVGMAVGAAIWGDCNWGWGHGDVDIDVDRYNNFNRNTNINHNDLSGARSNWNHDASHRKGVNYQNSKVAGQYGAQGGSNRVARDQARGHSGASAGTREARTPSTTRERPSGGTAADRERPSGGTGDRERPSQGGGDRERPSQGGGDRGQGQGGDRERPSQGGDRGQGASQGGGRGQGGGSSASASRPQGSGSSSSRDRASSSSSSRGSSAYSGSSRPSTDRASSSRGASSRGTTSYGGGGSRSSYGGGASRGGGGASRGGGGGRRR